LFVSLTIFIVYQNKKQSVQLQNQWGSNRVLNFLLSFANLPGPISVDRDDEVDVELCSDSDIVTPPKKKKSRKIATPSSPSDEERSSPEPAVVSPS
jgi:hypothetical protein